eukprot:scaffold12474_cov129-Isochrysis_galbana.AAC.1
MPTPFAGTIRRFGHEQRYSRKRLAQCVISTRPPIRRRELRMQHGGGCCANNQPTNQWVCGCFPPKAATLHQLHWQARATVPSSSSNLLGCESFARSGM